MSTKKSWCRLKKAHLKPRSCCVEGTSHFPFCHLKASNCLWLSAHHAADGITMMMATFLWMNWEGKRLSMPYSRLAKRCRRTGSYHALAMNKCCYLADLLQARSNIELHSDSDVYVFAFTTSLKLLLKLKDTDPLSLNIWQVSFQAQGFLLKHFHFSL